jgi:hypothetical protein
MLAIWLGIDDFVIFYSQHLTLLLILFLEKGVRDGGQAPFFLECFALRQLGLIKVMSAERGTNILSYLHDDCDVRPPCRYRHVRC